MATNVKVNDEVLVPRNRLQLPDDSTTAFFKTKVLEVDERSVLIDMPGHGQPRKIGSSAVHSTLGVCLFNIGDFDTETHVLNPLAESVRQYCNLLLKPFGNFDAHNIRSLAELSKFWEKDHAAASHVILTGHGSEEGILFGVDSDVTGEQLAATFSAFDTASKHFLSLCCETGRQGFAKTFSTSKICDSFIGPYHAVHAAIASQFVQNYLGHHFLAGSTVGVAFNQANDNLPQGVKFKLWQRGKTYKARQTNA